MNWLLYKRDDPNTWPKIDCPMVVCFYDPNGIMSLDICKWNKDQNWFVREEGCDFFIKECYYTYIGYIPNKYKTTYPIKCSQSWDSRCGFDDDGYCMADRNYTCQYKQDIPEYSIEKKRIWKEFV